MKCLCSDKTGTLTTAKMKVFEDKVEAFSGYSKQQVMEYAAVASNNANKDDPIDSAVFKAFAQAIKVKTTDDANAYLQKKYEQTKYVGFNPIVKRTVAYVTEKSTGSKLMVAKGIVNKILKTPDDGGIQWEVVDCDSGEKIGEQVRKGDDKFGKGGYKTIAVAVGQVGANGSVKMFYAGTLPIMDPPRKDTAETIQNIRDAGVVVKMITGDHLNIAKELARQIDLGPNIMPNTELDPNSGNKSGGIIEAVEDKVLMADGFAQVLPLDKLNVVQILQRKDMVVGMTGDGVNDAPALAKAQIGIAVADATDAAQSAADIVLTNEGLSPIFTAIQISRRIFKRLKSYVIYRICITVQVVFFLTAIAFLYKATFKPLYIILLALLHDLQIVTIAYDHQVAGKVPDTPTVMGLLVVSYTMGILMSIQTTLLYSQGHFYLNELFHCMPAALATQCPTGYVCRPECEYKDSAMFLQISNSSAILILSARTVTWFFASMPAWEILLSTGIGQIIVNGMMLFAQQPLRGFYPPGFSP